MKIGKVKKHDYMQRIVHNKKALLVQILLTCSIAVTVVFIGVHALYQQADQNAAEIEADFDTIIDGYVTTFNTMVIQLKEKIQENPSFDEMDAWLKSKEEGFKEAIGEDVYDGIAMTYKGGYAHSWSYGEYSNYDPNTRIWYQQAQKADGKITVVAPYVTFLDPSYFDSDEYILMTIAQKYNDEISFDYDIKIMGIKKLLTDKKVMYKGSKVLFYDSEGYILSTNDKEQFAHNVLKSDKVISKDYAKKVSQSAKKLDKLQLKMVDGKLQFIFNSKDKYGNVVCMFFPFTKVFFQSFFPFLLISAFMIMFEVYLYERNKRSMMEFHARDLRLSALADATYEEMVYVDLESMQFYGNERAKKLFGRTDYEDLFNYFYTCIVDSDEKRQFTEFLSDGALNRDFNDNYRIDFKRFRVNWKWEDGSTKKRVMEFNRLPFMADGVKCYGIAFRDVTESAEVLKDALRQAESASRAKGAFLSNMSHEIRTPLNAVIGYLEIVKDSGSDKEKVQHCIDNCEIAAKHLLQIINDILDMSSIETGKLKIAKEEFDLKKEIEDIVTIFFQNAKAKGVRFETHIEDLSEEWVVGDQLRLNQILMNLLSNAVKFTQENGMISLHIRQMNEDDKLVYIQFIISDTGIGMSKEYMTRLFKPFEQESATTAQKYGGSGLGLSITSNLISMMDGTIDVTSELKKGTTFTVTMHFEKAKEHVTKVLNQADYSHVRALVVDDQKNDCDYIKTMLKRCGVKSDAVTSGTDALKKIRARHGSEYAYDLCILDWNMPDSNGIELASQISQEYGKDMPIIIATAYDINALEEEAKKVGVTKVVAKPLFQSTLFDLLVSTFGEYVPEQIEEEYKRLDMSGVRVILAEDNAMNMDIAVTVLEKSGIQVDQAVNGEEAYRLFVNAPEGTYDLILMDIQMPVLNGYQATRKIRESGYVGSDTVPIIAMTANAFAEDVSEALANGMNAHIAKPVNYDKLFGLLQRFSKQ